VTFAAQEKIEKLKMTETRLDDEKKQLRVSLDDAGNQLMKTELLRQSLEGDVQRMKLVMSEKETENQLLSGRAENLTRQIHELESKTHSLTTTVDKLNITLSRSEQQESAHKNQVSVHVAVVM